jgi:hypothetical protein
MVVRRWCPRRFAAGQLYGRNRRGSIKRIRALNPEVSQCVECMAGRLRAKIDSDSFSTIFQGPDDSAE